MIPTLTTPRLTLGPFSQGHFAAFAAFCETDRSCFLGGPSTDPRDAWDSCMIHLGHWSARGYGGFFATHTKTGAPLGRFSIWHPITLDEPELSWVVYADFEGQGYAREGAEAVRDWAYRSAGLGPLMSLIAAENSRSIALAQSMGATLEGTHEYRPGDVVERYRHPGDAA